MKKEKHEIALIEAQKEKEISNKVNFIKKVVAAYYGETVAVYSSRNRKKDKLIIKHIAAYFCLKLVERSPGKSIGLSAVAEYFGYRLSNGRSDHATILHIKRKINGFIEFDRKFRLEIEKIESQIKYKVQIRNGKDQLLKDYYFIDLNNVVSMKLTDQKAIVLSGFEEDEVEKIKNLFRCPTYRKHQETSMYLLETLQSQSE